MRIQKHAYLAFKVEGQKLRAENTNPVLHKFYYLLNDFKIEKEGMKIVVVSKDPAIFQVIDSTWIKGSIHLNMEILNYREDEEDIRDIDHETGALILNELAKLKIDEDKIRIEVLEATFSQTQREHPEAWAEESLFRTQV
jgi:hypothetical protein